MAKFPYLTGRRGSQSLYYKRMVPLDLRGEGRPAQIWRSLGTADRKKAEAAYGAKHAEVEALFAKWRQHDAYPIGLVPPQVPAETSSDFVPLTPALLRRLADAHYLNVYEDDFQWRGDLWKKVHEDEAAFWAGKIIKLPDDDWNEVKGQQSSYFAYLMEDPILEEVFLYAVFRARKAKLQRLQRQYQLGDGGDHAQIADGLLRSKDVSLGDADRSRLMRKLMETEIKALEDITAGNEASFDGIVEREAAVEPPIQSVPTKPGELMSLLVEKYIDDTSRERKWPVKTINRKRAELREFLEIVGDKPVNSYCQEDGVKFKDVQVSLPIHRMCATFKGLTLEATSQQVSKLRAAGNKIALLSPLTINDKIGTVLLFFDWAKSRDSSVVNPMDQQRMRRSRSKRQGTKRHPWTIEELNRMFAAPIYTGCRSEYYWKKPGPQVLRHSAMYWVPLIALFSGMRLGEIIQLQVADVKCVGMKSDRASRTKPRS